MKRTLLGLFLAFLSVAGFSSTFVVGGELTKVHHVTPMAIVFIRFAFAGTIMLALNSRTSESRHNLFVKPTLRDWIVYVVVGVIGTSVMAGCAFLACQYGSSVSASMCDALAPLFIFLTVAAISRAVTILQVMGTISGFVGAMMVMKIISPEGLALTSFGVGDLAAIGSAVAWAAYTIWGRKPVEKFGSGAFTSITMVIGALSCLPLIPFVHVGWPTTWTAWAYIGYICIFPTFIAFWARNAAQKYISMTMLGMTGYFTPVLTMILAFVCFGETSTMMQLIGTLAVCVAAVVEIRR